MMKHQVVTVTKATQNLPLPMTRRRIKKMTKEKQKIEMKMEKEFRYSLTKWSTMQKAIRRAIRRVMMRTKRREKKMIKQQQKILQMTSGFLSNKNGIFGDSKDDQTPKKTRKTGRSLSSRISGIFTNNADDPGEVTNNVINFNINQTHQQKRVKNYKRDNKTNSRSLYNNRDIKHQNNKKKSRKKVKPTV